MVEGKLEISLAGLSPRQRYLLELAKEKEEEDMQHYLLGCLKSYLDMHDTIWGLQQKDKIRRPQVT